MSLKQRTIATYLPPKIFFCFIFYNNTAKFLICQEKNKKKFYFLTGFKVSCKVFTENSTSLGEPPVFNIIFFL